VIRARDRACGSERPSLRPATPGAGVGFALLVAVSLVTSLAACDASTASPGDGATSSATVGDGPATPDATDAPPGPTASDPGATSGAVSPSPGSVTTTSPSGGPNGSAAECSGSLANRDFFSAVAAAVDWDVYCGVLPDGWFVDDPSSYRLREGGQMTVTYRGPNSARLQLREGAFCADADGCVPSGQESGPATFGNRAGTLVVLEGGGYAIVVDRGAPLSWLAIGANLEEAEFRDLAAALRVVDG